MSCENCADVICSGGSRAPWQSRQVLGVCARTAAAQAHINTKMKISDLEERSFCHVSIGCHRNNVAQSEDAGSENKSTSPLAAARIEKRQDQP